jgi:hypothetical protein
MNTLVDKAKLATGEKKLKVRFRFPLGNISEAEAKAARLARVELK